MLFTAKLKFNGLKISNGRDRAPAARLLIYLLRSRTKTYRFDISVQKATGGVLSHRLLAIMCFANRVDHGSFCISFKYYYSCNTDKALPVMPTAQILSKRTFKLSKHTHYIIGVRYFGD